MLLSLLIFVFLTPIIFIIAEIVRTKKQRKTLASSIIYDNQLLNIKGEAQREPLRDRDGLSNYLSGDEYFNAYEWERSVSSNGIFTFCNKISLNIKNEGSLPIDTDVCQEPLVFKIEVRGKLSNTKVLAVTPANPKLKLSTADGMVKVEHIHLEPNESFQVSFLGFFTVYLAELF